MKKALSLALSLAMVLTLLAGCGSSSSSDSSSTGSTSSSTSSSSSSTSSSSSSSSSSGEAVRTDLNVVVTADCSTLDPHATITGMELKVIRQFYNALFEVDYDTNEIVPCLAEGYVISDDGMSVDITIKEGITFSNGDPLTTADVAFSINRAIDAPVLASYVFAFESAEVIDDTTVRLNMNIVYGNAVGILSKIFIVSESYTNSADDILTREPMGTGGYTLSQWDAQNQMILTSNESYFKGAPAIETVVLKVIPDSSSALIALETGDVDLYVELTTVDLMQAQLNDSLSYYDGMGPCF